MPQWTSHAYCTLQWINHQVSLTAFMFHGHGHGWLHLWQTSMGQKEDIKSAMSSPLFVA
jgi:hypothetical protein